MRYHGDHQAGGGQKHLFTREDGAMAARDLGADRPADSVTRRELPAVTLAAAAALLIIGLIYLGSRGLRDFDSALVGYAVGTVFAVAAIVYRYTRWITRPPTWRYF